MAFLKTANRAISTLDGGINDVIGALDVQAGDGALFPATGDFHITCEDEIMKCTARAGDTLTVTRAQEGTAGAAHIDGKTVELRITSEVIDQLKTIIQDAAGVTKVDVEESAAEKIVRMDVNSVEAFHLSTIGILTLAKQSRMRAYRSAVQSIPDASWTKLQFDTENYDNQNEYDNAVNYRFTATEEGYYYVICSWQLVSPVDQQWIYAALRVNGGAHQAFGSIPASGTKNAHASAIDLVYLAANNYLEGEGFQDSGGALNAAAGTAYSWLVVHKLS